MSHVVFEWGSGNSTLWFAKRVCAVTSVEHRQGWYEEIRHQLPENACIRHRRGDDYPNAIRANGEHFDIVSIDGRQRVACTQACLTQLTPSGVIVFDNSDRVRYEPAFTILDQAGFRRIDFWGMGPIDAENHCTSLFYRSNNCLGI